MENKSSMIMEPVLSFLERHLPHDILITASNKTEIKFSDGSVIMLCENGEWWYMVKTKSIEKLVSKAVERLNHA